MHLSLYIIKSVDHFAILSANHKISLSLNMDGYLCSYLCLTNFSAKFCIFFKTCFHIYILCVCVKNGGQYVGVKSLNCMASGD